MQLAAVEPINAGPFAPLPAFDPRAVPVSAVDAALPAVLAAQLAPGALRARFAAPPHWVPEIRHERRFADRQSAPAAVLVPIVMREAPTVLLTQRTAQLSTHAGQVAFPGGRVDPEDVDIRAAALREAWEEVGLLPQFIEVLGSLPTYTTGTSFIVTPVVALVHPGFHLTLSPHEVAESFEVPLAFLMNPAHHRHHVLEWDAVDGQHERREWFSMPYQDGRDERFVWGATAGMLRNLYRFLIA